MLTDRRCTPTSGVFELLAHSSSDARGSFFNVYRSHDEAFQLSWGQRNISQVNISRTEVVGTIRGLHMQADPHSEAKLVRCVRGRVWDVVVDLRANSPTYLKWHAVELTSDIGNAIIVPEGCAHGFQVLEPASELLYLHSGKWIPEAETGVRWDDPQLAITWPLPLNGLSERDHTLPLLPFAKSY
jgi:dTDP-4-dehydrorhamnose 3,5-epimerase